MLQPWRNPHGQAHRPAHDENIKAKCMNNFTTSQGRSLAAQCLHPLKSPPASSHSSTLRNASDKAKAGFWRCFVPEFLADLSSRGFGPDTRAFFGLPRGRQRSAATVCVAQVIKATACLTIQNKKVRTRRGSAEISTQLMLPPAVEEPASSHTSTLRNASARASA